MTPTQRTFFLKWRDQQRLATIWEPSQSPPGMIYVVAPPFAEELNRSRRTIAESGRAFARAGHALILFDLYGCGDSPGELGETSWSQWCDDLREAANWAVRHFGRKPSLLAVRSGSLFLPSVRDEYGDCVLWQPVVDGKRYLRQFLRIKVTRDNFAGAPTSIEALWKQVEQGGEIEVAGYALRPELALPMAQQSLKTWLNPPQSVLWIETGAEVQGDINADSKAAIEALRRQGAEVRCRWVCGKPFWSTPEIAENPALAEATLDMISGRGS